MARTRFPSCCDVLADCPAMDWATEAVKVWLQIVDKSEWIKFLVDGRNVDGAALMSLRKEDLNAALYSGYTLEELNSLMDCIRSLRIEQLSNPDQLLFRYLYCLSVNGNSTTEKDRKCRCANTCPREDDELPGKDSFSNVSDQVAAGSVSGKLEEKSKLPEFSSFVLVYSLSCNRIEESENWAELSNELPCSRMCAPVKHYPSQKSLVNQIKLDSNGRFAGRICHFSTPHSFYVTAKQWERDVRRMEDYLTKHSKNLHKIKRTEIFNGMACCVYNLNRGPSWMRGCYLKTEEDSGLLQIECVDHGYAVKSLLANFYCKACVAVPSVACSVQYLMIPAKRYYPFKIMID
ncbi:TUDOR domain containing protein [Trichuris trichiura]|uniref:TUDOR domain containing protein n=1 Tax=Trichuris trichiura TaxID=36087 RepID=A0A077ZQB9_TRITR|nr:TUDOR domain containing protein [Trichuris trichiura]